jgi:hypothetical protein
MDNKAFKELDEKSKIFFDKIINLFDKNKTDSRLFINFLLQDIIPIKQINKNNSLYSKLNQIIEEPDIFLEDYFDTLFDNNNNSYLQNQIKLSIEDKIKEIKKKIQECDRDIEKIIKFFVYLKISKKIAVETVPDFIFSKKSILYVKDERESYSLGEVFSRYLFFLIDEKDSPNIEKSKPDNFYNKSIFDFIESYKVGIKDFREWNSLVKYFPIHIHLIELFFNENSNYKILFSKNNFINSIYDLSKMPVVEKNKTDKKKKKDKKQRGGKKFKKRIQKDEGEGIKDILVKKDREKKDGEKKNNPYEKKEGEKKNSNEKKTKMIEICNKTNINKLNLKDSLMNEFHNIFFERYIQPQLPNGSNNNNAIIDKNKEMENPFNHSKFNLLNFLLKKSDRERTYTKRDLTTLKYNFKFDIFQILNIFKTQDNKTLLEDVLERFKYNIIILLFSLYTIKKKLYTTYINIALNKFNINIEKLNSHENKSNQKKNNTQNKEQSSVKPNNKTVNNQNPKKTNHISDIYKNMNQSMKEKLIKVDKNITTLKDKIKELESHKMQNYEKKILIVEEYIQKLILKKRDILKNT